MENNYACIIIICFETKSFGLFGFYPSYNLKSDIRIIGITTESGILGTSLVIWKVALKTIDFHGRQVFCICFIVKSLIKCK